jgi:hypothetical protein
MTARSFTATCPTHGWPLKGDECPICAARPESDVREMPCPPISTWPKPLRVAVLGALEFRQCAHGSEQQRQQKAWVTWLRDAAMDGGVIPRNGTPVPDLEVYQRMLAHLQLAAQPQ